MLNLVFYFQVHQPFRLRHYNVMDIGSGLEYFNSEQNKTIMQKVAAKCYLPANRLLLALIREYNGKFKVAYSITGTAVEQFKLYAPEVLESFRTLVDTGCVELLGETYYHSLSSLYDTNEFLDQVDMHRKMLKSEFGIEPTTFRNT